MTTPASPDLFDRQRRQLRRARHRKALGWLDTMIADQMLERLDDVKRTFDRVLVIGARNTHLIAALRERYEHVDIIESSAALARATGAIQCEEDALAVDPESYDLLVWPGGLESVNDVPGALLRARWALRPDGLCIGCLFGDGSFPVLRRALLAADAPQAIARMHPQISLPALGDLLGQAGLALIVTDVDRLTLSYTGLRPLIADLRDGALTNMLSGPVHRLSRSALAMAETAWQQQAVPGSDGRSRLIETVRLLHFSGWAPSPDQPQPARRGSATLSLASVLNAPPPA